MGRAAREVLSDREPSHAAFSPFRMCIGVRDWDLISGRSRTERCRHADECMAASYRPAPGSPVSVSDGSPRPTCASTATRWPRTPTTVTPVTFRERT